MSLGARALGIALSPIAPAEYVRTVLPQTQPLWGGRRDLATYAADFRADARHAAKDRTFAVGLRVDGALAASCKVYDAALRWRRRTLRATGIGAVFTAPGFRGRGCASALLGALLDRERAAGRDLAYLFSDIDPAFYARLGFERVQSRILTLHASALPGDVCGAIPLRPRDWPALRRCFEALDAHRPWGLVRTPLAWRWLERRAFGTAPAGSQPANLVVARGRRVLAYVLGRRVPREDAFAYDDVGFDGDEGRALLPPLLRAAAGDLRKVTGWMPPTFAREALPRGTARGRKDAVTMFVPLTAAARTWRRESDAAADAAGDPVWAADHV